MTKSKPIKVIVPDEPPVLMPQATRALLRLLLDTEDREEREANEHDCEATS